MVGVALVADNITSFNSAAAAIVVDSEIHAYRAYLAAEGGMRVVVRPVRRWRRYHRARRRGGETLHSCYFFNV